MLASGVPQTTVAAHRRVYSQCKDCLTFNFNITRQTLESGDLFK